MSATTKTTTRTINKSGDNSGDHSRLPKSSPVPAGLVPKGQVAGARPSAGYQVAGTGVAQPPPSGGYLVEGKLSTIRAKAKRS